MSTTTNSLSAAADILISVSMVFLLQKSKTGYKKTTDVINRLVSFVIIRGAEVLELKITQILFTFNAGLPTSVCALVAVITVRPVLQFRPCLSNAN